MTKTKLYSPSQAAVASFLGGPLAFVYVLWKNFRALGKTAQAKQTMIWGLLLNLAFLLMLPFIPDKFPNYLIPATTAGLARYLADRHHMTKQAIAESEQFAFQSRWSIFGLCLATLVVFLVLGMGWMLAAEALGLVVLPE